MKFTWLFGLSEDFDVMRPRQRRSTPEGQHRPVMLQEVLQILDPQPGMIVVDCTVGWAGHSAEILQRIGSGGMLVGLDMDAENLPKARERLETVGHPFHLEHANFAGSFCRKVLGSAWNYPGRCRPGGPRHVEHAGR